MNEWIRSIEWEHPEWLLMIIPIAGLWIGLSLFAWFRNKVARRRFAAPAMFEQIGKQSIWFNYLSLLVLQLLGITGIVVAMAAPKFGELEQPVMSSGHDIYVLLDVSRSMLAEDVSPSRLERAKADIASLTNRLKGERIGLIVFAGQPVIRCPLTVDYENFRRVVANVDLVSSPRGGTAIGKAIRKALDMFTQMENNKHTLLLITDGDDQNSDPLGAAREAAEMQVPINILGLGDNSRGARIPTSASGRSYVQYEGEQVWSKLDSELLTKLANMTGGDYIGVGTKSLNLDSLYQECIERTDVGSSSHTESITTKVEQYQWPLGLGTIAILASVLLGKWKVSPGRNNLTRMAAVSFVLSWPLSATSLVQGSQIDALNTSGLTHFYAGDLVRASEDLERAKALVSTDADPVRAVIDFNLGCIAQANGEFERAIHQYEQASRSTDIAVIEASQYQLGNAFLARLLTESAMSATTDQSENSSHLTNLTEPSKNEFALRAIEAYENTLSINPLHQSAKKHLESTKLWLASEQTASRTAAILEASAQFGFLDYLGKLIERQESIALDSDSIPAYRNVNEQHALRIRQMQIIDELPLLITKFQSEIAAPSEPAGSTDTQPESSAAAVRQLSDRLSLVSQSMTQCAEELAAFRSPEATQSALAATQDLEDLWNSIASYEQLLVKAYQAQSKLAESLAPTKTPKQNASQTTNESPTQLQSNRWSRSQFRNLTRTIALETKAKLMADALRDNLEDLNSTPKSDNAPTEKGPISPPSDAPTSESTTPNENDAATEDELTNKGEQLESDQSSSKNEEAESIKAALATMEKAQELTPQAKAAMEKAIEAIAGSQSTSAHQYALKAKSILEELLKSLPPPPPKGDQQQDSQNSDSSQQNQPQDEKSQGEKSQKQQSQDASSQKDGSPSQPQSPNDSQEGDSEDQQGNQQNEDSAKDDSQQTADSNSEDAGKELNEQNNRSDQSQADAEDDADNRDTDDTAQTDNKSEGKESAKDATEQESSRSKASNEEGNEQGISQSSDSESTKEILVSQERMDEIMRKVKEREAAKKIRDRRTQELLRGRQRVEKDW